MSLDPLLLWAHLLATVMLVGYYVVLAAILIPVLSRATGVPGGEIVPPGRMLAAIERRALPLLLVSLAVFVVTGIVLQTSDPRYAGIGELRGAWTSLLLLKHLVVAVMLVVGSVLDGMAIRAGLAEAPPAFGPRIVWTARGQAVLGMVVLLITAVAQGA